MCAVPISWHGQILSRFESRGTEAVVHIGMVKDMEGQQSYHCGKSNLLSYYGCFLGSISMSVDPARGKFCLLCSISFGSVTQTESKNFTTSP